MIANSPQPAPLFAIHRLEQASRFRKDWNCYLLGSPSGEAAPNGLANIMRRRSSGQSSLGVSGGLTLVKSAAAFRPPRFDVRTTHQRSGYQVEHFAEVQRTTAVDATHDSFYPCAGDHLRVGMTQNIGGQTIDHYWRISREISELIRIGEQEHLDDAARAFELTYGLVRDRINGLAGQRFGPAPNPAAATAMAEQALVRQLPSQLGTDPANWVRVLDRLLSQTESRDTQGWHALNIGPPLNEGNRVIHPVIRTNTTRVGAAPSTQVVNY